VTDGDLVVRVQARAESNLFWRHLGVSVVDAKPGWVRLRVPVRDDIKNASGAPVHGGVYSALVDMAVGGALGTLNEASEGGVGQTTLDLNVISTFLLIKHSAEPLAASGRGSFVGVSSHAGRDTFRFMGAYGAGKAGLDMMVRVAADELGGRGIRVNSVRPGLTRREAPSPIFGNDEIMHTYREQTPLVRSGVVDDCSYAVRYFAGAGSAWTTGQCLTIDGGMELRGAPDLLPAMSRFRELTEDHP